MLHRALAVYEADSSIVGTRGIQDSLMREKAKSDGGYGDERGREGRGEVEDETYRNFIL